MWSDQYLIKFKGKESKYKPFLIFIKDLLEENGFIVNRQSSDTTNNCILVSATPEQYYREAEILQILRPLKTSIILEEFVVLDKEDFVDWNKPNFFTCGERAHMLNEMLEHILPDDNFKNLLQKNVR